jgi:glycosyltransferase involved in cell wall biosynthesis
MSRVIFINRSFWPEETATAQLLTDLAAGLAQSGLAVTVIAGRAGEPDPHGGGGPPPAVAVERIRSTRLQPAGGLAGQALDLATFWLGALARLARLLRTGDAVVVLTDPPLLGIGVAWLARLRGARCFHWVQDIYPEIAIAVGGHRSLRALIPARNAAWRRAEGCVTLGTDMAGSIARAGIPAGRIRIIPNWAPAGLAPAAPAAIAALRAAWGLTDAFVVEYSGNLGRVHEVASVLRAAEHLRDQPRILFLFVGGGPRRARLEREAARRGLTNVRFQPHQPRARLSAVLGVGDVHLVSLRPGCETCVFPSKLYGAAAVGRPVIFVGPVNSEVARTVTDGGWGAAFDPADSSGLAQVVADLSADPAACARLAAAALRFAAAQGGAAAAAAAWREWLAPGDCPARESALPCPTLADRPPA